jgi:hypothetical protein
MVSFPTRICIRCYKSYTPTGPAQKVCVLCKEDNKRETMRRVMKAYRLRQGHIINVGSGGTNDIGQDDSQYKTGIRYFMRRRRQIKAERRYCERCGKDLQDASHAQWNVHHRDHDRTNNTDNNFELLCVKCHRREHHCQDNLPKAQRPSRKGVGSSAPETPGAQAIGQ